MKKKKPWIYEGRNKSGVRTPSKKKRKHKPVPTAYYGVYTDLGGESLRYHTADLASAEAYVKKHGGFIRKVHNLIDLFKKTD